MTRTLPAGTVYRSLLIPQKSTILRLTRSATAGTVRTGTASAVVLRMTTGAPALPGGPGWTKVPIAGAVAAAVTLKARRTRRIGSLLVIDKRRWVLVRHIPPERGAIHHGPTLG